MTRKQLFLATVLLLILYIGSVVALSWFNERAEVDKRTAESHERIMISKEETKRLGLFTQALKRRPDLNLLENR